MKTESQNRREERLAERAVKGTDFRAEGREERRDKTAERERKRSQGWVRSERSLQRKEQRRRSKAGDPEKGNMVKCLAERDQRL